jgi:hypothetical protein
MQLIKEMTEIVGNLGEVNLEVEYSAGESPNEIEFEAIRVSDKNNLSLEEKKKVEKILECGLEETLVKKLVYHYKGSGIVFSPNHYDIA